MISYGYIATCDVDRCDGKVFEGEYTYQLGYALVIPSVPKGWTMVNRSVLVCPDHRRFEVDDDGRVSILEYE